MRFRKKIFCFVLSMVVAVMSNSMSVSAQETVQSMQVVAISSDMEKEEVVFEGINNYEMSKFVRGNGIVSASLRVTPRTNEILIEMSTGCSFVATKVGVKNVYVQEKVWYGWKTIAQAADYATSSNAYSGQAHCTNATKGKTYRVLCTHYAIESNGTEHIVANQSEEFVYN